MEKLMRIHERDTVLVVKNRIGPGDVEEIDGVEITFDTELAFGHKVAGKNISKGEKIIKFGVPIGSAMSDIAVGSHVHLHNLKSDYISTFTLDHEFIKTK